jgi:hypothetical protein
MRRRKSVASSPGFGSGADYAKLLDFSVDGRGPLSPRDGDFAANPRAQGRCTSTV